MIIKTYSTPPMTNHPPPELTNFDTMDTKLSLTPKDTVERCGLLKVPDEAVIRALRVELGQANAYIDELKEEIKILKDDSALDKLIQENKSLRGDIRVLADRLNTGNDAQEIRRLRKYNSELIAELIKLKNKK